MTAIRLYHGLHTNAYGEGGRGFRTLFVGGGGPSADAERVGRWLQSLRPEGGRCGFAANCFRVGGATYAALARVEPGFSKDEHGREGGLLVHALFSPLAEDRHPGDFGGALLAKARSFQKPDVEDQNRLGAYLEHCRLETEIEIDPVEPARFHQMDPAWLGALISVVSRRALAATMEMRLPVDDNELPDAVVGASIALPPRLRLGLRWGVGIRSAPGINLLVRSGGTPTGPGLGDTAGYLAWLLNRLRTGKAEDVRKIVESWEIRSWDGLIETVTQYR